MPLMVAIHVPRPRVRAKLSLLSGCNGRFCTFAGSDADRMMTGASSVAGERGRKPVVLYGAAKAGLTRYLEGLDHRFHSRGLRVVTIKPGFVRTSMTEGLPEPPFACEPEVVARRIARAVDRGEPVVYVTPIWRFVMAVIRRLPRAVMRRVGF